MCQIANPCCYRDLGRITRKHLKQLRAIVVKVWQVVHCIGEIWSG